MTYYRLPRIGWFALTPDIAYDIAKETGLDHRRKLHAWRIRWLDYEVLFSVKETEWDADMQDDIYQATVFWGAEPKPEPEVADKKPSKKRAKKPETR